MDNGPFMDDSWWFAIKQAIFHDSDKNPDQGNDNKRLSSSW